MTEEQFKRIILVETNLFFSAKIRDQLVQLGFSVDTETDYQVIRNKAGLGISAIIIDLAARDIHGLEMVDRLKHSPETASIPLIGFCGHKEHGILESARSYGCNLVTTNAAITSDLATPLEKTGVDVRPHDPNS